MNRQPLNSINHVVDRAEKEMSVAGNISDKRQDRKLIPLIQDKEPRAALQSEMEGFSSSIEGIFSTENNTNNELFSGAQFNYWIPWWLPEESLFSLISRAHSLSKNRCADATTLALFGHRQIGCAHDLPARIDELVRRTGGRFGDAETLIRQRTVLASYLPLLDQLTTAQAIGALRSNSIGPLKTHIGLLASGFGADHPLRACPDCMEDDREVHGVAYWHMPHQWPGVWFCTRHQLPLLRFRLKSNGVERFLWHMPDEAELAPAADLTAHGGLTPELESLLAGLSHGIDSLSHGVAEDRLNQVRVATTLKLKLMEKGFMSVTGRLRNPDVGEEFSRYFSPLASFPPLMFLAATPLQALSRIQHMIGNDGRQPRHPVTHVATALWLFGSWEHFINAYKRVDETTEVGRAQTRLVRQRQGNPYAATVREQMLQLVQMDQISPTAAAKQVGVDTQTAVMWAFQAGLDVTRRSKKLTPSIVQNVIAGLERGEAKRDMAEQNGLSVVTVTRLLLSDADLLASQVPVADEAQYQQMLFRLRREGLASSKRGWHNPMFWGIAATIVMGVGVVIQMGGLHPDGYEKDVLRNAEHVTVLIVADPEARLAELQAGLQSAGEVPKVNRLTNGQIVLTVKATEKVLAYLLTQRLEPEISEGSLLLRLTPEKPKKIIE